MIRMVGVLICLSALAFAQQNSPLDGLANLSDAVSRRASSADRTGGNADRVELKAGATATLADIHGAGSIRHIWFTINSPSPFHLRQLVLRMYWDGETEPSVEVPIGDFFGTGFEMNDDGQKYHSWWSLPITVQDRALNCYLPGKGRARYVSRGSVRFQPLPIGTAREVFPQAARPVNFVETGYASGREAETFTKSLAPSKGWTVQSQYSPRTP